MTTIARIYGSTNTLSILGELHEGAALPARYDAAGNLDTPELIEDGVSPIRHQDVETDCSEFLEGCWLSPSTQYLYVSCSVGPSSSGKIVRINPEPLVRIDRIFLSTTIGTPAHGPHNLVDDGTYLWGISSSSTYFKINKSTFLLAEKGNSVGYVRWTELVNGIAYGWTHSSTISYIHKYDSPSSYVGGPYTNYYDGQMHNIGGKLYLVGFGALDAKFGRLSPFAIETEVVLAGDGSVAGVCRDDRYFYAVIGATPGKLFRFDYINMAKVGATVTCPHALYKFIAVTIIGDYLYITTVKVGSYPRIYKYSKIDLSYITHADIGSPNQFGALAKITNFEQLLYTISSDNPAKVIQIDPSTLSPISTITLESGEPGLNGVIWLGLV